MSDIPQQRWQISVREAAKLRGVSTGSIRRALATGALQPAANGYTSGPTHLYVDDVKAWTPPQRGRPAGAMPMPRGVLSVADVAALRECSTWTVLRAIRGGAMAATRVGRARYAVTREHARAWTPPQERETHPFAVTLRLTQAEHRRLRRLQRKEETDAVTVRRLLESALTS